MVTKLLLKLQEPSCSLMIFSSPIYYMYHNFHLTISQLSKLISSLDCELSFTATSCEIQDQVSLRMIGAAQLQGGLYTMKFEDPKALPFICIDSKSIIYTLLLRTIK